MPEEPGVADANQNQPNNPEPLFHRRDAAQQIADIQNNGNRFDSSMRAVSFVPFQRMTTNKAKNNILKNWKKIFVADNTNQGEY